MANQNNPSYGLIHVTTNCAALARKYNALATATKTASEKTGDELAKISLAAAKKASTRFKSPGRKGLAKMGHPFAARHACTDGSEVNIVAVKKGRANIVRALKSSGESSSLGYLPYPPQYIGRDYGSGGISFAESWKVEQTTNRHYDREVILYNTKKDSKRRPLLQHFIHGTEFMIPRPIDKLVKEMTLKKAFNLFANVIIKAYNTVGSMITKTSAGTFFQRGSKVYGPYK